MTEERFAPPGGSAFSFRQGARIWVLFALAVVAFCALAIAVERTLGDPFLRPHFPAVDRSVDDALWHLATGLILALPLRRRAMLLFGPLLAVSIDVDHAFGGLLPAVAGRQAHSLFFLPLVTLVLYRFAGRAGASLGAGAFLVHLGVDGGTFPLLAPATIARYGLPLPLAIAFVATAGLLYFASVHSLRDLRRPGCLLPVLGGIVAIALLLVLVPGIGTFNSA
jgi:hypothetical protein